MKNCRDCFHYDVCQYHITEETNMTVNECNHFKDKSRFVELPCKVGDTVYVITNCENIIMYHDNDYFMGTGAIECPFENSCDFEDCDDSNLRIFETRVVTIHCEEDFGWTIFCEHINKDIVFSEVGKTVFLAREEAEQVLKGANMNIEEFGEV